MHLVAALHIGRSFANDRLAANQRWTVGIFGSSNRCINCLYIMSIDIRNHVPAVALETLGRIVAEPALNIAINGNTVVVIQNDQLG